MSQLLALVFCNSSRYFQNEMLVSFRDASPPPPPPQKKSVSSLGPVHSNPDRFEIFENGIFVPKTHQIFSVHIIVLSFLLSV